MKQILLLTLFLLLFTSCKPVLLNTYGRHYIKKMHNGGTVVNKNYAVEVPFEIVNEQIILKVYPDKNSKDTLDFLFDSGTYSGVSDKVYEKFKGDFANLRTDNVNANKAARETEVYLVEKLYIGEITVENFNLTIDEYVNKNLDGVIGADFMKDKVFIFDFPNNKMIISDISPKKSENDYHYKLKRSWDKKYSSQIKVGDTKMKVNYDTGATGFLKITDDLVLDGQMQTSYEVVTRGNERYHIKTFTVIQGQNLSINSNIVESAFIIKSADYNFNFLGTALFLKNKVILDCKKKEMRLQLADEKIQLEVKKFPTHSFAFGWTEGLKVVQKKVEVLAIDLELLDKIIQINGKEISSNEDEAAELLKSLKDEKVWKLRIKRGEQFIEVDVPSSILEY